MQRRDCFGAQAAARTPERLGRATPLSDQRPSGSRAPPCCHEHLGKTGPACRPRLGEQRLPRSEGRSASSLRRNHLPALTPARNTPMTWHTDRTCPLQLPELLFQRTKTGSPHHKSPANYWDRLSKSPSSGRGFPAGISGDGHELGTHPHGRGRGGAAATQALVPALDKACA